MPEDLDLSGLTLEDLEAACESAIKAATAGRQTKTNLARELRAGRAAFRRRLRALAARKQGR